MKDPMMKKYKWKKFNFSLSNAAMMRIRILSLNGVIEDLELLYSRTTNFYGQARKMIELILEHSNLNFTLVTRPDNIREVFRISFNLFAGPNAKEPENDIKIEDLLSRAIAQIDHTDDKKTKELFSIFIQMFKEVKKIQEILGQCYLLGYDFEQHFLNKTVEIRSKNLGKLEQFKKKITNYIKDIKDFLRKEDQNKKLGIKDFLTGRMIKKLKPNDLRSIIENLKWWKEKEENERVNQEIQFETQHYKGITKIKIILRFGKAK